jgi:hypothetical protein
MAMITLSKAARLQESIRRKIGTLPLRAAESPCMSRWPEPRTKSDKPEAIGSARAARDASTRPPRARFEQNT